MRYQFCIELWLCKMLAKDYPTELVFRMSTLYSFDDLDASPIEDHVLGSSVELLNPIHLAQFMIQLLVALSINHARQTCVSSGSSIDCSI